MKFKIETWSSQWDPLKKAWVGRTPVEVVRQRLEQIPDVVILT